MAFNFDILGCLQVRSESRLQCSSTKLPQCIVPPAFTPSCSTSTQPKRCMQAYRHLYCSAQSSQLSAASGWHVRQEWSWPRVLWMFSPWRSWHGRSIVAADVQAQKSLSSPTAGTRCGWFTYCTSHAHVCISSPAEMVLSVSCDGTGVCAGTSSFLMVQILGAILCRLVERTARVRAA